MISLAGLRRDLVGQPPDIFLGWTHGGPPEFFCHTTLKHEEEKNVAVPSSAPLSKIHVGWPPQYPKGPLGDISLNF